MAEFKFADRVLAVIPGVSEVEIVEGFVTAVEKDGKVVAVRPATTQEWENDSMDPEDSGLSWWWDSSRVFHVVDAEAAVEAKNEMETQWHEATERFTQDTERFYSWRECR